MDESFHCLIDLLDGKKAYLEKIDRKGLEVILHRIDKSSVDQLRAIAPEVFQTDPEFEKLLREAADIESFEPTKQYMLKLLASHNPGQPSSEDKLTGPGAAFVNPYFGAAADGLFEHLELCNKNYVDESPERYYSKHCSITQSSGTGKTRAIFELAKRDVIVVYLNIRLMGDNNSFPRRDAVPANIVAALDSSADRYTDRCVAFFHALLEALLSHLKPISRDLGRVAAIEAWTKAMCTVGAAGRKPFFDDLQANYDAVLLLDSIRNPTAKEENGRGVNRRGERYLPTFDEQNTYVGQMHLKKKMTNVNVVEEGGSKRGMGTSVPDGNTAGGQVGTSPDLIGGQALIKAYIRLIEELPQLFEDDLDINRPKMVIAFDEAHMLSKPVHDGYRPSDILCKVIGHFTRSISKVSNWVVFASTVPKVAESSAPSHIYPSHRISQGGKLLFPPYVDLGWDQMAPKLEDLKSSPQDVACFERIVRYGRPLWTSLLEKTPSSDTIVEIAGQKLCRSLTFNPKTTMQALAAVSQRFCLDTHWSHHKAIEHQQKLVSSHMCICDNPTEDPAWQNTRYPSEPLLSCAAARLLHKPQKNLWRSLDCLWDEIAKGLIDMEKRGELVSRLILLLAKDLCVRVPGTLPESLRGTESKTELLDCRPLSVTKYLNFLFGDACTETANGMFDDWYIDFSHWISMGENIKVGSEGHLSAEDWITRHWHRTSAIQCCHNQATIDKVIPMYRLGSTACPNSNLKTYGPPDPSANNTSYILISDKGRKDATPNLLDFITPKNSIGSWSGNPYVAIHLDLRVNNGASHFAVNKDQIEGDSLRIYAPGFDVATYPFLAEIEDSVRYLRFMVDPPTAKQGRPLNRAFLNERIHYGDSDKEQHMRWEAGAELPPVPGA